MTGARAQRKARAYNLVLAVLYSYRNRQQSVLILENFQYKRSINLRVTASNYLCDYSTHPRDNVHWGVSTESGCSSSPFILRCASLRIPICEGLHRETAKRSALGSWTVDDVTMSAAPEPYSSPQSLSTASRFLPILVVVAHKHIKKDDKVNVVIGSGSTYQSKPEWTGQISLWEVVHAV